MALVFDISESNQIFNWSDTINIENAFSSAYRRLYDCDLLAELLVDNSNVQMRDFRSINQFSVEEEVTLRLMNLSDQDIDKILKDSIQYKNFRLLPLGIPKSMPSPIISYKYGDETLTSIFLYSDTDESEKESKTININKSKATVFNLIENILTSYLSEHYNIPISTDALNICMSRSITISDCKFILYYYYYLLHVLSTHLGKSTILQIFEYRINNSENGHAIIPGKEVIEKILNTVYENDRFDLSKDKEVELMIDIYNSCNLLSDVIDEYELSLFEFEGSGKQND
jgi:hypothetical protein